MKTTWNKQQEDSDQMYVDPKQLNKTSKCKPSKKALCQSKISQTKKDKYGIISLVCGI